MDTRLISIVVPVRDEQDSLRILVNEIDAVASERNYPLEVVFVDDGSSDASWQRIVELARDDSRIGGLRFRGNFGKAAALMAGFAAARGELVFMMDADLQDPPIEIPRFLEKMAEGWDVVSGWKRRRLDPWHKVYPSRVFNRMISRLTGVRLHDHVCGFKCFRREVLREVRIHGEYHRFLGVFAAARGFKVTEIPTLHRARTTGAGKYGFTRFLKGFLDLLSVWMLTRYRWRPQHVIGLAGLICMVLWILTWLPGMSGPARMLAGLAQGALFIALGMVAAMIAADRPNNDLYAITERVGWCATADALDSQHRAVLR